MGFGAQKVGLLNSETLKRMQKSLQYLQSKNDL